MRHRTDRYVCQWEWEREEGKRESGREKTKTGKKSEGKTRISTIHSPLISSVYDIKAITGCLCQRVWNNTLVSEGEMRWGRRRMDERPLHQLERRLVAAVTDTRATDTDKNEFLSIFSLTVTVSLHFTWKCIFAFDIAKTQPHILVQKQLLKPDCGAVWQWSEDFISLLPLAFSAITHFKCQFSQSHDADAVIKLDVSMDGQLRAHRAAGRTAAG